MCVSSVMSLTSCLQKRLHYACIGAFGENPSRPLTASRSTGGANRGRGGARGLTPFFLSLHKKGIRSADCLNLS